MEKWTSGMRGAAVMVVVWTVGWGLGFGGIMELVDPHGEFGDVWPTAMALPGLLGGVLFCGLLRMAEARRSFDEVSLGRSAAWGGLTGLLLAGIAISKAAGVVSSVLSHVALGMAAALGAGSSQLRAPVALGILTALGAIAAFGSTVFFRLLTQRQTPAAAARPS